MVEETGCDAIMIGRAAASNPWIFRQIQEFLKEGHYYKPSENDRWQIMHTYFAMLIEKGGLDVVGKMKQFATYFTHGVRDGAKLRTEIYQQRDGQPILDLVDRFFEKQVRSGAEPLETVLL